ncbi:hypothetical protein PVAND_001268 [Polypedilum vanderplanki]|uniref:Uncharacterized protein n=1 Tax=Polypedilum vanderplanki TaxID=319348 RepID=A0A9J6BMP9_POLVA|nr:hypothetical protein PVAND_001268 [Polypedilum vanderplanki]
MSNMKILFVLSCIIAVTLACTNCGPPQDPDTPCSPPDCRLPQNHQNDALFPHPDPNFYWQCYPHSIQLGWQPIARPCACGTVFNPHIYPRRCSFWWESTWYPICDWQSPPELAPCAPWCPDCDNGGPPGDQPITITTTTTIFPELTTTTANDGVPQPTPPPCDCPPIDCPPCIWWPCVPCPDLNPCYCNNDQ